MPICLVLECAKVKVQGKDHANIATTGGVAKKVVSLFEQVTTVCGQKTRPCNKAYKTEWFRWQSIFLKNWAVRDGNSGECPGLRAKQSTGIQEVKSDPRERLSVTCKNLLKSFLVEEME